MLSRMCVVPHDSGLVRAGTLSGELFFTYADVLGEDGPVLVNVKVERIMVREGRVWALLRPDGPVPPLSDEEKGA